LSLLESDGFDQRDLCSTKTTALESQRFKGCGLLFSGGPAFDSGAAILLAASRHFPAKAPSFLYNADAKSPVPLPCPSAPRACESAVHLL
ncbi:MAG: hypothetical protein LUD54_00335, partial [Oscillospiraceae bacterium]|nr:hypothetical protein [Oscillospiraceae bacterium]